MKKLLACGCALGWERCIDCRAGLHMDQEIALAMTLEAVRQKFAKQQQTLGKEFEEALYDNLFELYAR